MENCNQRIWNACQNFKTQIKETWISIFKKSLININIWKLDVYIHIQIYHNLIQKTQVFLHIYIYKEFSLEWGFKLNGGSKPPFSDSGILKKSPESENGGLRRIWNPHWFWKPHSSEICLYINLTSIHVIRADKKRRNILLQIHYWFWFCHLCMFTSCSCYWNF